MTYLRDRLTHPRRREGSGGEDERGVKKGYEKKEQKENDGRRMGKENCRGRGKEVKGRESKEMRRCEAKV